MTDDHRGRPGHPTLRAALVMIGVVVAIIVLSVVGTLTG
jgi:hypothetical protein